MKLQQRKPLTRLRESLITKPNSGWFEPPAHNALETSSASPSKVASKTQDEGERLFNYSHKLCYQLNLNLIIQISPH